VGGSGKTLPPFLFNAKLMGRSSTMLWKSGDGETRELEELSSQHLKNIMGYLERAGLVTNKSIEICLECNRILKLRVKILEEENV
jgi:hypothetical protein